MLKNKIVFSTLTSFLLSSTCLFATDSLEGPLPSSVVHSAAAAGASPASSSLEPAFSSAVHSPLDGPSSSSAASAPAFLRLEDRLNNIQQGVDRTHEDLSQRSSSSWGLYNGDSPISFYYLCNINDPRLIYSLLRHRGDRKELHLADIGGGKHGWIRAACRAINAQTDLPDDLKIHLYSLRGEGGPGVWGEEDGRCKLYEYNGCKIENLSAALKAKNINVEFDLIVSRWSLRHLVDPLMTFKSAYDQLNTGGFLAGDGFYMDILDHPASRAVDTSNARSNIEQVLLLQETGSEFLIHPYQARYSLNQFIVRKTQAGPCQLPLRYAGSCSLGDMRQVHSQQMTYFERLQPRKALSQGDFENLHPKLERGKGVIGSQSLYTFLRTENIFFEDSWDKPPAYWGDFSNKEEGTQEKK